MYQYQGVMKDDHILDFACIAAEKRMNVYVDAGKVENAMHVERWTAHVSKLAGFSFFQKLRVALNVP